MIFALSTTGIISLCTNPNQHYHTTNTIPYQAATQDPEICGCGLATFTDLVPVTLVTLPSTPVKVQSPPPWDWILITLNESSASISHRESNLHVARNNN